MHDFILQIADLTNSLLLSDCVEELISDLIGELLSFLCPFSILALVVFLLVKGLSFNSKAQFDWNQQHQPEDPNFQNTGAATPIDMSSYATGGGNSNQSGDSEQLQDLSSYATGGGNSNQSGDSEQLQDLSSYATDGGNSIQSPANQVTSSGLDTSTIRELLRKWRADGEISEAEFIKLNKLVTREEADSTSVDSDSSVETNEKPAPIPLSQFKKQDPVESIVKPEPIPLSQFATSGEADDSQAESQEESPEIAAIEDAAETTPPVAVVPTAAREISESEVLIEPAEPKRKFSDVMSAFMESRNVRWFEFIAGISIIGSTIGLVATLHVKLRDAAVPYLTALLFMAFSAAIIGVGVYVIKRLKLPSSGRATLIVGALLLPINFIAATVLEKHDVSLTNTYFLIAVGLGVPALGALGWVALKHISKENWLSYWLALMGPSIGQIIVKRVIEASDSDAFLLPWNVLAVMLIPLVPMVIGVAVHLKKMAGRGTSLNREDAYSIFELLGLGVFSVCACGFLLFHFGVDQHFVGGLATPILILSLTILSGGLVVHKGIVGESLAVVRTIGSWLMVTGGAMALLSIVTAWPDIHSMLIVSATAFIVFVAFGFLLGMPYLLLPAAITGTLTSWLVILSVGGTVSSSRELIDQFFSGANALNFLVCSVIAGICGVSLKAREHRLPVLAGAGIIAVVSIIISVVVAVFEPAIPSSNFALIVFLLAAIGAICAIPRVKHHAIWMVASGLTLAFWAYFTHSPWIQTHIVDVSATRFEVLIHGVTTMLLLAVIGLKWWDSRLDDDQREKLPAIMSGAFKSATTALLQVATVSMLGGLCLTFLKTYLAQHQFAMAGWMMMLSTVQAIGIAVSSKHKKWYALAQLVTILLAITCTSWATSEVLGDEFPSLFSWEILRIQVLVQSALMIGWFVLRKASYLNSRVGKWVKADWMYVDYIVQGLNTIYFLINILIVLIPQIAKVIVQKDYQPVADAFLHPGDIQMLDWVALSSILVSWLTVIPDRYRWAPGLGILTTIAMLPMLVSLGIQDQQIVDLVLMWGYGFFSLFTAIALSTRHKWFGALEEMLPRLMEDTIGSNQQIWMLLRRVTSVISAVVVNGLALSIYVYLLSGEQFKRPGTEEGLFLAVNPEIAYSVPMFLLMGSYLIYAFDLKRPSQLFSAGVYWYFGLMYVALLPLWQDEHRINYTELLYSMKWSVVSLASFSLAWSLLLKWKPTIFYGVVTVDGLDVPSVERGQDRFFKIFRSLMIAVCASFVFWSLGHGILIETGVISLDSGFVVDRLHPNGQFADLFSVVTLLIVLGTLCIVGSTKNDDSLSSQLLITLFGLASLIWHGLVPIQGDMGSGSEYLIDLLKTQSNVLLICSVVAAAWVYCSYAQHSKNLSTNQVATGPDFLSRALSQPPTSVMYLGAVVLIVGVTMLSFEQWPQIQAQFESETSTENSSVLWTIPIYYTAVSLILLAIGAFLRRNRFILPAILLVAAIPFFVDGFSIGVEGYQLVQLGVIWLGGLALIWKLLDYLVESMPRLTEVIRFPDYRKSASINWSVYTITAFVAIPSLFYVGISVLLAMWVTHGVSGYLNASAPFFNWDAYVTVIIAIAAISVWSKVFSKVGSGILAAVGLASLASLISHSYGHFLSESEAYKSTFQPLQVTHCFVVLLAIAGVGFVVISDYLARRKVSSLDDSVRDGSTPLNLIGRETGSWFAGLCLISLLQLIGLFSSADEYSVQAEFHFPVIILSVMALTYLLYGAVVHSEKPAIISGALAVLAGFVFATGVRDEIEELLATEAIVLSIFSSVYLVLQWLQSRRSGWKPALPPTRIRANHVLIPSAYILIACSTLYMLVIWGLNESSVNAIAETAVAATWITVFATILHLWDLRLTNVMRRIFIGGMLLVVNLVFSIQTAERLANVEVTVTTVLVALAVYSFVVSVISTGYGRLRVGMERLRICDVDGTLCVGGKHVLFGQFYLLAAIGVLSVVSVLMFDVMANRFLLASTPLLIGVGLSIFQSRFTTVSIRFFAWLSVVCGMMLLAIASLPPGLSVDINVERIARVFVSLSAISAVVILVDRFAPPENLEVKKLIGRIRSHVIRTGISVFSLLLAFEIVAFNNGGVHTPPWLTVLVCAAVATIVFVLLTRAIQGSTDGREMSDRFRQGLVYLSEILVVGIFAHVYLVHPDLFSGIVKDWWAYIMMALAFIGAFVAQKMHDRGLSQISEPLFNTSFLLPVIPLVGVWMLRQQAVFDYSFLLSLACLANVVLGLYRKSFFHALAAAIAGNGSLWVLMSRFESWSFADHPQFWIIPPALSVLVAAHLNRNRLKKEVLTMTRYLTISTIYLSSGSEILLHWSQDGSWQKPLILMMLGIAGAFAGVIMRIRAFLFLGTAFTLVAMISMIVQYAIDNSIIWWISGITIGVLIWSATIWWEKRKQDILPHIEKLQDWDG